MKLQQDLREFIELLNSLKVEYIVVGGHAVAFHGLPVVFLGLEALLKNKQASGRDKDLGDVKKLQAIAAKTKKIEPG